MTDDSGRAESGQCFTVRGDVTRMISGQARQASDERRRAAERLLEMGDRYRSMSMMDLVDECHRIEGRTRTTYDQDERIRAAFSGSALSAIFTQNVSAQFLGGYLDAEDTSVGMFTETDVPNFLQNERAIYGKMGQLHKIGKGGTAADLDTSDWNEVYKIFRYAGKFLIDEQDFINDRFSNVSPDSSGHRFHALRGAGRERDCRASQLPEVSPPRGRQPPRSLSAPLGIRPPASDPCSPLAPAGDGVGHGP